MANPEQLEILKQGVKAWNGWRKQNPTIQPYIVTASLVARDFLGINLIEGDLRQAILNRTILVEANLVRADLRGANLSYASLQNADLSWADLRNADLRGANFHGAFLDEANFDNSILGETIFSNNDLSNVKGLRGIRHQGPSTVSIDTLYHSKGNIPETFLRKVGLPENFIIYMRSLTRQALDFYKCFISFTEADDAFSERLYNDLQGKGVRCWRWKEDAKWGKSLMSSIDEAVRVYDKLIVICSEQSLNSPAVIREIERALQKEDDLARQGKEAEVLFPIRLDDYIFIGWTHHRKADVVAKNVGDFRDWNEPDRYKKAFDRLIRDLKASE
jgi:uncharacterized protein YjbI with pentapeptide repeats